MAGLVQLAPMQVLTPENRGLGHTFYVHSVTGASTNLGKSPKHPLATIAQAVAKCTASEGDIIVCLPGHAETISATVTCALSKIGISVIGLGVGAARPTLTFSTSTAATLTISGASITVKNLLLVNNIDSQVVMVDVNASGFVIEDCEFRESSAKQALTYVDINGGAANACDHTIIRRCKFTSVAAGADRAIELGEVADGVQIEDCVIDGDFSDAGIHNITGKVMTDLLLKSNVVRNRQTGDHAVELVSACTGFAVNNRLFADTAGTVLDPGSLFCAGNEENSAIDIAGTPTPYGTGVSKIDGVTMAAAPVAGSLARFIASGGTALGAPLADSKSLVDALGVNGTAVTGVLTTQPGSVFWVKKTLTSSDIKFQSAIDVTGVSSGGALAIRDVILQTDSTGIATGTNFQLLTNNTKGVLIFLSQAISGLGANATVTLVDAATTKKPTVLETGKKIQVQNTIADSTGGGTVDVYIRFERLAAGATVAAA